MAYMSQDHKKEIVAVVKPILAKYGIKGTFRVRNHSALILNIKSGVIDFIGNYNKVAPRNMMSHFPFKPATTYLDVNTSGWYKEHFSGKALECLKEVVDALHGPRFFNDSDIQTDYFSRSHYVYVNIGDYATPYVLTK